MTSATIIRTQVAHVVRQIAARYAEECIEGIMSIARDTEKAPTADRLKAYSTVLDRAAGKPTQEVAEETGSSDRLVENMRKAAEAARTVMSGQLPPPSEQPMGEVVELRPNKKGDYVPAKIPRRRLRE